MQEDSSLSQREGGGGCSSFHLRAIHLLAVAKAILINRDLRPLTGNTEASPNRASLGSGGICVSVIVDMFPNTVCQ